MVVGLVVPGLTQDNQRLITDETLEDLYRNGNHSVITLNKTYEGIKGTPFLVDEWLKGSFTLLDSTTYSNVDLKYDLYNEMLVVKDARTGRLIAPEPASIQSFTFSGRNFLALSVPEFEGNSKVLFWEIIYQGNRLVGRHINKILKEANYEGAYNSDKPYDELQETKPRYVYRNIENELVVFKKNKKSIMKAFPASGEIEKYIKSEKLNLKKEEDIIRLAAYMDTIY